MTTTLQLKDALCEAIKQHEAGKITLKTLYAAADIYLDSLKAYKESTGKRFRIPSRGYIIRAFR